jgi:hypothetical protein
LGVYFFSSGMSALILPREIVSRKNEWPPKVNFVEKLQCHPILDLAIAGRAGFFADGLSLPKVLLRALVKRLTGTGGRPFRKPPTKRAGLFDCPPAPEGRAIWKALLQKGTLFQKPFLCQGAALLRKPSWRRARFSQSPPALQGEECRKPQAATGLPELATC